MQKLSRIFGVVFTLALLLTACGGGNDGPVQVEIISLDHSPIRPAVQEVEALAAEFGDKVVVQSYYFDTPEGTDFAEDRGLEEHTPIAVFVNGEMEFEINGRSVKFYSFPQGGGTGMVAEGIWTIDDLQAILEQETN